MQETLEDALARVLRLPGPAPLTVAGRTDAGVHARGQVAHCDVPSARWAAGGETAGRRLSRILPPDVRVHRIGPAPAGFDARFSAIWRRYAYRVTDVPPDPLTRNHVLAWPRPLDHEAMDRAAGTLTGLHDFAAFCKAREGATTIRTLQELGWSREGDVLTCHVRADAFCHHMVRSLVGALVAVGEARRPSDWPRQVLEAGVRDPAVLVMPAHGLTLEEVAYPPDDELAARVKETRVVRTT